jgi:hypothetical protein
MISFPFRLFAEPSRWAREQSLCAQYRERNASFAPGDVPNPSQPFHRHGASLRSKWVLRHRQALILMTPSRHIDGGPLTLEAPSIDLGRSRSRARAGWSMDWFLPDPRVEKQRIRAIHRNSAAPNKGLPRAERVVSNEKTIDSAAPGCGRTDWVFLGRARTRTIRRPLSGQRASRIP